MSNAKRKRGMSAEDKRSAILRIYHERKEPFNLKEMEQHASRAGVVQQTVKDMNQSLVDDFMVMSDKIGSANFFWSFPSKAYQDQLVVKESRSGAVQRARQASAGLREAIQQAQQSRSSGNGSEKERSSKLGRLRELQEREKALDVTLEEKKFDDPEEINKVNAQARINEEAAIRWTDNVWMVKAYFTKKRGMSGKEADKILKIAGDFDTPPRFDPNAKKNR